ncbi:hypothetical protein KUTeg_021227 [Tegillarca granosa]|uniref:Chitin-binding type-2 domain-containing protein n=1 Tax=Tegillarca granosa TaxID=220873 RepID=A0ABQ9EAN0_TEGGR|nr:hypothetical protein KUTeg_021227 [Tegillarca granosa]
MQTFYTHFVHSNFEANLNGGWADWNDWSVWGDCSTTCDEGIKYRNRERTCTNPEPLNGGNDCPGSNREVESTSCLLFQCPTTACGSGPGEHHKHPDPQKCNMFLNCGQQGETYEQACQPGLAWNEESNACDQSSANTCLAISKGYFQ